MDRENSPQRTISKLRMKKRSLQFHQERRRISYPTVTYILGGK
jgi:hypothetical protein